MEKKTNFCCSVFFRLYLCTVKKVVIYISLILLISSNTSFLQLLKVGFLIQHYQEHKESNNQLSLLQFLSMHYWGNDIKDNDDEKDNQLPFKKPLISLGAVFLVRIYHITIRQPFVYSVLKYCLPKPEDISSPYEIDLLKPPKALIAA